MLVDIHVHTSRHSDCGRSDPDSMVEAAIARGLDAIVLTEHNYMWTQEELAPLQRRHPEIKLFGGIEVSVKMDGGQHMVILGVPDPDLFYPTMPPAELIAAVRRHGGAAILAHPYRWTPEVHEDILRAGFDAIEICSNSIRNYMQQPICELQRQTKVPLVVSSDGHHVTELGLYALDLPTMPVDDKELAAMIRHGEFSLWCNHQRIDAMNAEIRKRRQQIPRLLEQGLEHKSALHKVGLSKNLAYALEKNLDIYYPKECKHDY